jgi:hypothetical protein
MIRKITRAGFIALGLVGVTLGGLTPRPKTPPVGGGVLFPGGMIDRPTLALFERSFQNCHSENTKWPWYSRIPTASWMIAKDVREARSHVNFSNWNSYSAGRQENFTHADRFCRAYRPDAAPEIPFCTTRRSLHRRSANRFTNGAKRRRNVSVRSTASPPHHREWLQRPSS